MWRLSRATTRKRLRRARRTRRGGMTEGGFHPDRNLGVGDGGVVVTHDSPSVQLGPIGEATVQLTGYFPPGLVCFRSNARIRSAIFSPSSSRAKCPVSSRWNSMVFKSRLYGSAPAGGKIASFFPHTTSVGGWCLRKYSCHFGYSLGFDP